MGLRRPRERRLRGLNPGHPGPVCGPSLPPEVDEFDVARDEEAKQVSRLGLDSDEEDEEDEGEEDNEV